jgi:phage tail-like protein
VALTPGSTRGWRADPFRAYNFAVEIGGVVGAGFSEVSGLSAEVEVLDYREGGRNEYMHRLAGPGRYPSNLVLKRGLGDSGLLWAWYLRTMSGTIVRSLVSVLLFDGSREVAWRWDFMDAYPVKWSGPELRAATGAVAFETVEFAHRGLVPGTVARV